MMFDLRIEIDKGAEEGQIVAAIWHEGRALAIASGISSFQAALTALNRAAKRLDALDGRLVGDRS